MSSDQLRRDYVRVIASLEKINTSIHKIEQKVRSLEREKYLKEEELKLINGRIEISRNEFANSTRRGDWLRLTRQRTSARSKILQISRKITSSNEEKSNLEIQRSLVSREQQLLRHSVAQGERGESSTDPVVDLETPIKQERQ